MRGGVTPRGGGARSAGFSLVETLIAVTVLSLSSMGFVAVTVSTHRLEHENEQFSQAMELAREVVEQMQAREFSEVFARHNTESSDDPDGPGTAVGSSWTHQDSYERQYTSDEKGVSSSPITCRVEFPVQGTALREDLDLPEFGLPTDLNSDGVIDSEDHSGDYVLLPVVLRLSYPGATGVRNLTLTTVLIDG